MEKFYAIRKKLDNNTYSEQIPVSALAENVVYDSNYNLIDVLGTVDVSNDGNLQDQINDILANAAKLYSGMGINTDGAINQNALTGLFINRPFIVIGKQFPQDAGFNESVLLFDTTPISNN